MRIFIIHNFYQHAGGEDVVFKQETALLQKEHSVQTFSTQNSKGLRGIKQFIAYPFNLRIVRDILKEVDQFKPEVVHIHNMHYAIGPWLIRKLHAKGYPIVITLHNYRLLCPSATLFHRGKLFTKSLQQHFPWTALRMRVLDRSFIKTAVTAFTYWFHRKLGTWSLVDRYILLSTFAKEQFLASTISLPEEKLVVKGNFSPSPTALTDGKIFEFLYVGRLAEEKGIIPLLEALVKTPYRIKVLGTGPQLKQVKDFAHRHPQITYVGFQPTAAVQQYIAQAEALIVPSICYEGMPMTIMEAFSLATPVLCSNIGILKRMVAPMQTGLHFNPFEEQDIITTLNQWKNLTAAEKQHIGENAQQEYQQHYTAKHNKQQLLAIYQQAILNKQTG